MANIRDVARVAGVSTASVSRYLAGERVRSATSIANAVRELGYVPSVLGRSLKSGRHSSIGVLVPDVTNPFFATLVKGIEQEIRDTGYHVLLVSSDEDPAKEEAILPNLLRRTDGVVIAPVAETDAALVGLSHANVPAVLVDRELSFSTSLDCVLVDNVGGATEAADHLVALGHRRIAVISGPLASTPGRERHEGFLRALQRHGIESDEFVEIADFREEGGFHSMLRLWRAPVRPTAVFVSNNLMTIGALRALKQESARVPADVAVIGFDDFSTAALLDPPLTVIRRPEIEQGAEAARLLLARMGNTETQDAPPMRRPKRIRLPVELVVRGSTAKPGAPEPVGNGCAPDASGQRICFPVNDRSE